ncbi:MAG TPA: hypothetical protein PLJ12_13885, partial [Planctomycetota bacterium]|nr:hypothetical protein [Planctomycetota bacterium]
MKLPLLLGSLACLSLASPELRFAPEEGSEVTKTFTSGLDLTLDSMEVLVTVHGEEHPLDEAMPEMTIQSSSTYVFRDAYQACADGRPTKLKRHFETLESQVKRHAELDGKVEDSENEKASDLLGATVQFTWDDSEEGYKLAFADQAEDEEYDEALLEGQRVEADYTGLLPKEEVELKDTWEIDAEAFYWITSPGGDLHLLAEDEDADESDDFDEQFHENLDGTIECTLDGIEDGIATVLLTGTFTTKVHMDIEPPEDAPEEAEEVETFRDMGFEYELEGKLLWDLKAHRAQSLEV